MDEKKNIIKKYKFKIAEIKEHNKSYFIKDNPKISDREYDSLKRDLIKMELKYSFLRKIDSVNKIIGSTPSNKFKKVKHLSPMLSLSNAFNKSDMEDFIKKINNFLNSNNINIALTCEPKIDGISATLIYENGIFRRNNRCLYGIMLDRQCSVF